jgi:hypothetical protein
MFIIVLLIYDKFRVRSRILGAEEFDVSKRKLNLLFLVVVFLYLLLTTRIILNYSIIIYKCYYPTFYY